MAWVHTVVDRGVWCLVKSRGLEGGCKISMHLQACQYCCEVVVCGVWSKRDRTAEVTRANQINVDKTNDDDEQNR